MNRLVLAAAVLAGTTLVAEPVGAQCLPVFTLSSTAPNTGQAGVMFDMEPTGGIPLRIESFDIYVTGAAASYEVWVRQPLESFVGFQSTMAGWTQIGNATVAGLGTVTAVPLNLCLGYTLAVGGPDWFLRHHQSRRHALVLFGDGRGCRLAHRPAPHGVRGEFGRILQRDDLA